MSRINKTSKHKRKRKIIIKDKKQTLFKTTREIMLSYEDRITYAYLYDLERKARVLKEIYVSYEILIEGKWFTVKLYDSAHGYLHRHTKVNSTNKIDIVATDGVKKKGNNHDWLTWAIDDIKKRYISYKNAYVKRNEDIDK